MKQRLLGLVVLLSLMSPLGCLSPSSLTDVVAGDSAQNDSASVASIASAADLLTGVLGDDTSVDVSKRDLLVALLDLYAASADPSSSEAAMLDLAAAAARDGRAGIKRSLAEIVIGQVTQGLVGAPSSSSP